MNIKLFNNIKIIKLFILQFLQAPLGSSLSLSGECSLSTAQSRVWEAAL